MSLKLSLRVCEASDLAYMTSQDESYPYCLLQVSNTSQIKTTRVCEKTVCPVWEEQFSFSVKHKTDSLKLFIKDSSTTRTQNVLSTLALKLKNYSCGATIDQWFTLTPSKGVQQGGKIHLVFRLDPTNKIRVPVLTPRPQTSKTTKNNGNVAPSAFAPLQPLCTEIPVIKEPPTKAPVPLAEIPSLLVISADFGNIIDTENPNSVSLRENVFDDIGESPAKMYTADEMSMIMLEKSNPIFGPYWALAKIASFISHQACDFFTNFAVIGCEKAANNFVLAMKKFFDMSNHDINRNRINFCKDKVLGPLMSATFNAYDTAIAAMARKKTLVQARNAMNDALGVISEILEDQYQLDNYNKVVEAMKKGCADYKQRENGVLYRNLDCAVLESLGVCAATVAFGLSSLEHAMNCYICNSFGSRIIIGREVVLPPLKSTENIQICK